MQSKLFDLLFRFLELIDLRVNGLEPGRVISPKIFSAGPVSDFLQGVFININGLHSLTNSATPKKHRHRGHAAHTNANRIDFDLERFGSFSGSQWCDLTGIVLTIGHQDHNFAFGFHLAQAVHGRAEGRADRGSILVDDPDLKAIQVLQQKIVIQCEGS